MLLNKAEFLKRILILTVGELKGLRAAKDLLQESAKYIENDDN
jgi:hypothetical protein